MAVRVVLADDHSVVREGLRALLEAAGGFEVVECVGTAAEAIRSATTTRPDVLVLDIGLPDASGIEAAQQIRRSAPDVAILMLTMYDDEGTVTTAMRAGAMGYVLKGADPDDVIAAIHAVARGGAVLGPGVAARALERISQGGAEPAFPTLTAREREVLGLIATGMGNANIAARLSLSPHTVGNHVTSIFAKLGVATRAEAIVRAREAGLGA